MAVSKTVKKNGLRARTQRDRISEHLLRLAPNVTVLDRRMLIEQIPVTKQTLTGYLKGNVMNNDLGLSILVFIKERIDKRESQLKDL